VTGADGGSPPKGGPDQGRRGAEGSGGSGLGPSRPGSPGTEAGAAPVPGGFETEPGAGVQEAVAAADGALAAEGAARARTRASAVVTAAILLSRISGLVRERVFAHFFGAEAAADAWKAALRLPNVIQNLLGEGTLSASFIPIYAELVEEGRDREAARFAGAVIGFLTLTAGVLALVGILVAPWLVALVFYGFDPARQALTVELVRILFPMTALLVLSAWALGILNSHRRFFLPYVAPVIWNGAMISAMLVGGLSWGLADGALARVLAWGALVGGGLQLLVQLPLALKLLREFRPALSTRVHGVREAIRNFVPVVAARGAVNLGGWADYALAGLLTVGAVSTLAYAQILFMLPISLFGMAVAASELPEITRRRSAERRRLAEGRGGPGGPGGGEGDGGGPGESLRQAERRLAREVAQAGERVAYYLVPSTIGYLLLGDVIVAAVLQTGAFGADEVRVTWIILGAYALGMGASATSRLLSSAFYAFRDTATPAKIAYLRIALALAIGASLMFPLDRFRVGALGMGAAALAFGSAVAAWVELGLLRRRLGERLGGPVSLGGPGFPRLLLAGAAAGGVGLGLHLLLPSVHPWLVALGTLGPFAGVYLAATRLLGVSGPLDGLLSGQRARS
jgi:putative peptidoglycan lipid II flippase